MVPSRARRSLPLIALIGFAVPSGAVGQSATPDEAAQVLWRHATEETTGTTLGWTNKVEIADVDGDGRLDILHANGGDYDTPGDPARQAILRNRGDGRFEDITDAVLPGVEVLARVIKARDVTGDGITDLLLGTTYQTQSQLYRGLGEGAFEDGTGLLPELPLSVGDLEVGDVDGDLDIDIVLADWGPGSPMGNAGGPVHLWRNTGEGWADDAAAMPGVPVGFSWDLELVDVDGDWDLDIVTSCKMCPTSQLYLNDGTGTFTDATNGGLPGFANNYEFEAMDLDGDGDPELVTINDGQRVEAGFPEHVLRNEGGTFIDASADWWPASENPGFDDNVVVFLDADSDGDADFLVGSLDGPDRLIRNDGTGRLTMEVGVFDDTPTPGTLGLAVGDLDGDGRLDVVEGSGEVIDDDHVFLATDALPPDTAAPTIGGMTIHEPEPGTLHVIARIDDRKSPVQPDDLRATARLGSGSDADERPLRHIGGDLWATAFEWDGPAPRLSEVTICATDRAGNATCP